MMRRSFTGRLVLAYATLTTFMVVLVLFGGRYLVAHATVHSIDLLNAAEFQELAARVPAPASGALDERALTILREHTAIDAPMFYFQVHANDGTVLFRSANLGRERLPATAEVLPPHFVKFADPGRVRVGEYLHGSVHVQIASALEQFDRFREGQDRILVLLGVGVALLSVMLGFAFARLVLRPVRAIERTAARISAANLSERIPAPGGDDELAHLVGLLNHTFDRLEQAFAQVRRFSTEASHELKTPLALVRLHGEKLARSELAPAEAETVRALLAEAQRLQKIIDDLLVLSRSDAGEIPLRRQPTDTVRFLGELAEDAQALAEDRGLRFVLVANEPGTANLDPSWMRRVLLNLLSNALKVSPDRGEIRLCAKFTDGGWRVSLCDEGPGVPAEDLERMFERFVQLGASRTSSDGVGLGLAIARSIVARHGGRIWAENRTDHPGLRVTVELPLA